MKKHRTAFSYYGGKGMCVGRYPTPKYNTIIEPFAGGAAYSLRYCDRDVHINDLNADLMAAWEFIRSGDHRWLWELPVQVQPGDKISDMGEFPAGLDFLLRSAANIGSAGQNIIMNTVTSMAAPRWHHNTVSKIRFWRDRIRHWTVSSVPYWDLPDVEATWFVDPPYQNAAGRLYKHRDIDYDHLADFCRTRRGQVIVCEQADADWLSEFKPLAPAQGTGARHIRADRPGEVVAIFDAL